MNDMIFVLSLYRQNHTLINNMFLIRVCLVNYIVVTTNWLTITKYIFLKYQVILPLCLFTQSFTILYYWQDFYCGLQWVIRWVYYKKPSRAPGFTSRFFGGDRIAHSFTFLSLFCIFVLFVFLLCVLSSVTCISWLSILYCLFSFV